MPVINKLEEVFEKTECGNENQQEVVAVEIDSDLSEDSIRFKIRALPNIAKSSVLMKETVGSSVKSCISLR